MPPTITVTINGEPHTVEPKTTLLRLLDSLEEPYDAALVERNGRFVHPDDRPGMELEDGDTIEVILPAFGG